MFAKIEVNGDGAHPLFRWLKKERSGLLGGAIKWNFTKFLVGRDGTVLDRFAPTTTPDAPRARHPEGPRRLSLPAPPRAVARGPGCTPAPSG